MLHKKQIVLIGLLLILLSLFLTGAGQQGHPYAGFGFRRCDSDAVIYLHKGYNTDAPYSPHYLFTKRGEETCCRKLEIYWHEVICADCNYRYPGEYPLACRIRHSRGGAEYLEPCTETYNYFVCYN